MSELFDKLNGAQILGLVAIVGGTIYLSIDAVVKRWMRVRRHEAEVELKRELLAAGKPTEEIERIIRASSCGKKDTAS